MKLSHSSKLEAPRGSVRGGGYEALSKKWFWTLNDSGARDPESWWNKWVGGWKALISLHLKLKNHQRWSRTILVFAPKWCFYDLQKCLCGLYMTLGLEIQNLNWTSEWAAEKLSCHSISSWRIIRDDRGKSWFFTENDVFMVYKSACMDSEWLWGSRSWIPIGQVSR